MLLVSSAVLFYITSYLHEPEIFAVARVTREFYLSTEEFIDAVAQQLRGKIQLPATV
jgi:hypothetical protein